MKSKQSENHNLKDFSKSSFPIMEKGQGDEVDLNCDMGEGIGMDESIMPYISSANIACGYHAGDESTIWETMELAKKYNVFVGADECLLEMYNIGRNELD